MSQISRKKDARPGWASYHIFFNSRPCDEILTGLVLPVVRDLWGQRRFLRFFFIRYGEGGSHIRLRLLCSPEEQEGIGDILKCRASGFFGHRDAQDPADHVLECPFEPETERYGGAKLLGPSLDFFCLSSAHALRQIEHSQGVARSRHLALSMRALVRQALGFAVTKDDLPRLAAYVTNGQWRVRSTLTERADREFDERREQYVQLLTEEIGLCLDLQARSRLGDGMLTDGALLLSQMIRNANDSVRWRILSSQLHMTWNRMGIRNLEEVYLARILWQAVRHLVDSNPDLRSSLIHALAQPGLGYQEGFDSLIPACLAQLAEPLRER